MAAEHARVAEQAAAEADDRAHQARIADKRRALGRAQELEAEARRNAEDFEIAHSAALAKAQSRKECDLERLETTAILGKLTDDEVTQLEQYLAVGLTGRARLCSNKASRMLMVNAFSTGDHAEWERHIRLPREHRVHGS